MLNLLLNNEFKFSYVDDRKKCLVSMNFEELMSLDETNVTTNILCKRDND